MTRPHCLFALSCALLSAALLSAAPTYATLITFDLRDPNPGGGSATAGELFEGSASSVLQGGVELGLGLTTTLGNGTALYTAVQANGGVDTLGLSGANGDSPAEIDAGETVTFTTDFSGLILTLNEIDFSGAGDSSSDAVLLTINNGPQLTLFKGLAGFSESSVWTPGSPIGLASGDTIAISATSSIGLQSITFNTSSVPEPSSALSLFLLSAIGFGCRHRR